MKHALLAFFVLSSAVLAQVNPPPPTQSPRRIRAINSAGEADATTTLPENYILTLTTTEKDKPVSEHSLVVATPLFNLNPGDLTFSGTINPEEGGSFLVNYSIGISILVTVQNNPQYKTIGMSAAVRLRPGDSVQIYKGDERSPDVAFGSGEEEVGGAAARANSVACRSAEPLSWLRRRNVRPSLAGDRCALKISD